MNHEPRPPFLVGVLGGVASGKSAAAREIARVAGGEVIDADAIALEAYRDQAVRAAVAARFGADVFDDAGAPRREILAERAFASAGAIEALGAIVHPWVRRRIDERLQDAQRRRASLVVLDVPLLAESGMAARCDALVFVDNPEARRQERARKRGHTADMVATRERHQWPLDRKRALAHHVMDNSGTPSELRLVVEAWWRKVGETVRSS